MHLHDQEATGAEENLEGERRHMNRFGGPSDQHGYNVAPDSIRAEADLLSNHGTCLVPRAVAGMNPG